MKLTKVKLKVCVEIPQYKEVEGSVFILSAKVKLFA